MHADRHTSRWVYTMFWTLTAIVILKNIFDCKIEYVCKRPLLPKEIANIKVTFVFENINLNTNGTKRSNRLCSCI